MSAIKFGTDGWRAVMCDTFTFGNVRIVAQAVATYLKEQGFSEKGMIVGYDTRFLADRFAREAAAVLAANGVPVRITETDAPTPVVAYSIVVHKAAGALMFTASHNPAEYQGVKFIPDYAGPATPQITGQIEANIAALLASAASAAVAAGGQALDPVPAPKNVPAGLITEFDPKPEYLEHVRQLVDLDSIRAAGLRVVCDPMFGTGRQYLPGLLAEAGCQLKVIHSERDPLFGGTTPEPLANHLTEMSDLLRRGEADLGLATDGDADRFGIIDSTGEYVSPNQVISLLLDHQVKKGHKGGVARTVATTHLLDRLAARHGLPVTETPVGFKYICQVMRDGPIVIGGEESGGLSIGTHIPEKDGILACLLVAELRAKVKKPLREVLDGLMAEVGPSYARRIDIHYDDAQKKAVIDGLKTKQPAAVQELPVVKVKTADGVKVELSDGSWFLVRASGTEPLVRVYVEAGSPTLLEERISGVETLLAGYL